ncbi:MAG: UDP-3-O-acyl-N-acetylglucosamine deacetylase [Candidatus Margulisiibacteriota bacterium]|nr:UDP-3-O-acyl-N-acetylglucosamine deacetylase [Candidatus Margulisiibacteriota bacterium]
MNQKTIKKVFKLGGVGIHSGKGVSILVSPADDNHGIIFIKGGEKIPSILKSVNKTKRGTTLAGIAVVEHLLAAAYALGIDNLNIEVSGDEIPAMDGSALLFTEAFLSSGIKEQNSEKNILSVSRPDRVTDGKNFVEVLPYHGFKINFMVNFPGVGEQNFSFDLKSDSFKNEIAPARTFGYMEEYELLKEQGLALGANMENALVLGKDGYVNTPRFPDEPVRHKILDLIGDLSLLGHPIEAEFNAVRSGHKLNTDLVHLLLKMDSADK